MPKNQENLSFLTYTSSSTKWTIEYSMLFRFMIMYKFLIQPLSNL